MDVMTCDKLKTAIITYPKSGSCSLVAALNIYNVAGTTDETPVKHKWHWSQGIQNIKDFENLVPKSWTIYAICRDPAERWLSGFTFLLQTYYDFFHISIDGCNAIDKIAEADDSVYYNIFQNVMNLNHNEGDLNDTHMVRWLFPIAFLSTLYENFNFVDLNNLDKTICKINNIDDYEFVKSNAANDGYNSGFLNNKKSKSMPIVKRRFDQLLLKKLQARWTPAVVESDTLDEKFNRVRLYLHLEKIIFSRVVLDNLPVVRTLNDILNNEEKCLNNIRIVRSGFLNNYTTFPVDYFENTNGNKDLQKSLSTKMWHFKRGEH